MISFADENNVHYHKFHKSPIKFCVDCLIDSHISQER